MKNEQPATSSRLYSPRATLCAIGIKLRSMKLFESIADHVKIKQKTIKHTPVEKLTDAFIAILAGAHGLAEINTRVRSDAALQRAFGRSSCAEQSVVQETLDACTVENVRQMKHAFEGPDAGARPRLPPPLQSQAATARRGHDGAALRAPG